MPGDRFSALTRWFLYLLIGSIGLGSVLAIVIVLAGNWGWFETRVLLTTAVIAGASIFGMACAAALARTGSLLPAVGIVLAVVAAILLIAGMWLELNTELYWKSTASILVFAVASAFASVLALARLEDGHRWVQYGAYALALLFAIILVGIIVSESGSDAVFRVLAVVGILTAASGLLVPVVHFLDRRREPAESGSGADLPSIDAEIARLRARIVELEQQRGEVLG